MRIGVPKELKPGEFRIALTPSAVGELVSAGHEVMIESGAGNGSRAGDEDYSGAGAEVVADATALFERSELIVKVKEPTEPEIALLQPDHTLFCYLHLAPNPPLTDALLNSGATCIAFEEVEDERGRLPLLTPMSEIAGRIATQAGASTLEKGHGGPGLLMGGIASVRATQVTIIGGGVVGVHAAMVALGMGADVCIFDRSIDRLRELDALLHHRPELLFSSPIEVERRLPDSDVVIGAVLKRGATAPHVLHEQHLKLMKEGAVLVDVAIDQGGCFETSHPTTHLDPTFEIDGVIHYCVANMPGAVPITSTAALSNAILPYVARLAGKGPGRALAEDPKLARGTSVVNSALTSEPVASSQGRRWIPAEKALQATG